MRYVNINNVIKEIEESIINDRTKKNRKNMYLKYNIKYDNNTNRKVKTKVNKSVIKKTF